MLQKKNLILQKNFITVDQRYLLQIIATNYRCDTEYHMKLNMNSEETM